MSDTIEHDEVEVQQPEDIRSALNAAIAEHAEKEAPEPREQKAPKAESVEAKEPAEEPEAKSERARGPDGKFVKAEGEKPEAEAKPEAEKTGQPVGKEPPQQWREADKQLFRGLPDGAKDFLLRRHADMEADYTRKTQQIAELRRDYEPVAQIFAPHRDRMAQMGATPATLVQAWASVEQRLMQGDGVNVIRSLVDGYKIPREQIAAVLGIRAQAPATMAGADQQPPEPVAQQPASLPPEIMQELQAHRAWINQEAQRQQYAAQQQHYQTATRITNELEQFKSATDSAGNLLHPHFADLEHDMAAMVHARRASGLADLPLPELYDHAAWANPSVRALLIQQQTAAVTAQRAAEEQVQRQEVRAKAEKARRAGASVTAAPGGSSQTTARRGDDSIRSQLRAAYEDANA